MSLFIFSGKSRENRMNLAHDNLPSRESILRQAEHRRAKRAEDARRFRAALQIQRAARRWLSCKEILLHFLQELSSIVAEMKTMEESNILPRVISQSQEEEKRPCMQHNPCNEGKHITSSCCYCNNNNVFSADSSGDVCGEEHVIRTATRLDRAAGCYNYLRRHEELYNTLQRNSTNTKEDSNTNIETQSGMMYKLKSLESIQEIETTLFRCLHPLLCNAHVLSALSKHFTMRCWLFLSHVVLVQMANANNNELIVNTNMSNFDGNELQENNSCSNNSIVNKGDVHTNCMMLQRTLHTILKLMATSTSSEETSNIAFFIGTMIMYFVSTRLIGSLHSTRIYLVPVVQAAFYTTCAHTNANINAQRCTLLENKPLTAVYAPTWSTACLSCLLATQSEMYLSPTASAIEVLLSVHTHRQVGVHNDHGNSNGNINVKNNTMEFLIAEATVHVAQEYIHAKYSTFNANSNNNNNNNGSSHTETIVKNEVQFMLLERLVRLLPFFLREECTTCVLQNQRATNLDKESAIHDECEEVQQELYQTHERHEFLLKQWLTCIAILTQQQSHSELFIRSILFDLHYSRVKQTSKIELDVDRVHSAKENDGSKCNTNSMHHSQNAHEIDESTTSSTNKQNNVPKDMENGAVVKGTYRYLISYLFSEHGGIQLLEQLAHQSKSKPHGVITVNNINTKISGSGCKKEELLQEEEQQKSLELEEEEEEEEQEEHFNHAVETSKVQEGSEYNVATTSANINNSGTMLNTINKPTEFKSAFEIACDIYAWPLLSFMLTTSPQLRLETAAIFTKLVHTTHLVQLLWHLYRDTNPALRRLLISPNNSTNHTSSRHSTSINTANTDKIKKVNDIIAEALKSNDTSRVINNIPTMPLRRLCQRAMTPNIIVRIPCLPELEETFTPESLASHSTQTDRNTKQVSHSSSVTRQRQRVWRLLYQERNPSLAVLFFTIYSYYIDVTNVREDLQANNVLALHESWALVLVLKEIVHRAHFHGVLPHSGSAEVAHIACVLLSKLHIINEASPFVPFPSLWLSKPELVAGRGSSSMAIDLWNIISQVREEEETVLAESSVHDEDMLAQHLTLVNNAVQSFSNPPPTNTNNNNNSNTRVQFENNINVNGSTNPSNTTVNGQSSKMAPLLEHTTQDHNNNSTNYMFYSNTPAKEDEMFRGSVEWNVTQRMARLMVHAPFLVPFPERAAFLTFYLIAQQPNVYAGLFDQLIVHRGHIFADAFVRFRGKADSDAMFNVRFADENDHLEEGYGQGVYREYLASLCNEGFAPEYGLFSQTEDGRVYPNPFSFETTGDLLHLEKISFLGAMVGRALRDGVLQTVPFALPFCNSLLGRRNSINNLKSFDDELYKQLMFLTTLSEEEMAEMGLTFTYTINALGVTREVELIQGGAQVRVDQINCLHYIHLVADFKLNREGARQVKAFQFGLESIISQDWLKLFDSNELFKLFCGDQSGAIDIDDWERNTTYDNDSDARSIPVRLFWQVVRSLTTEQQSKLLRFATSLRRPPLLGFRFLSPPFKLMVVPSLARDRLPSASTCFSLLKLPVYDSFAVARAKIIAAIEETNTFEMS